MSSAPPPAKLDLGRIIAEAFALPWRRRGAFAKALAVPALAIVAMQIGWGLKEGQVSQPVGWAAWAGYGILWILFAVACHRLVLLELRDADIAVVPGWGRRETVFLSRIVILSVLSMAAVWVALMIVGTVVANVFSTALFEAVFPSLTLLVGTYLFARFAFLLPAAAIDAPTTLDRAWRQTRGNGWRMLIVVGVLPWTLHYAAEFVGGEDRGMAWGIVITAVATILMAVEVSALSLSYRELAADDSAEAA